MVARVVLSRVSSIFLLLTVLSRLGKSLVRFQCHLSRFQRRRCLVREGQFPGRLREGVLLIRKV